MAARSIGKLVPGRTPLFLCDLQEKFRKTIQYFPDIVEVSHRMLMIAKALDIPVVVSEQYPSGLGATVTELGIDKFPEIKPVAKTQFSMCTPEIVELMKSEHPNVDSVILCGIATHVCVQNTALNLLENDYNVHIVADGSSSCTLIDRFISFDRMKMSGAFLTTSESAILSLLGGASHPKFKELQKYILCSAPDTGLLTWKSSM